MKKMMLMMGVVLLLLCTSFAQVNANQNLTNDNREIQDLEPELEFKWSAPFGDYNLNLPNAARIDYLFKIKTEDRLKLFGVKISSNWGGTSYITTFFSGQFDFTRDQYYEVKMVHASLTIYPEDFKDKPYFINDPLGGTKLAGIGFGIKVYA